MKLTKKHIRSLALAILVIALGIPSSAASKPPVPTLRPNTAVMLVAHRGVKMYTPENTLPAIQKAIDLGYSYVELDVRYSSDGIPYILHDPNLMRTTGRMANATGLTMEQLKKYDAGATFAKEFKGTRIPTLEEALQVMHGKIKLYLDQKELPNRALIDLLSRYDFYPDNIVIVGSGEFQHGFLALEPDAPAMPGLSRTEDIETVLARFPSAVAFNTDCADVTPEMVDAAHSRGVMVFSNALEIRDPEQVRSCLANAIDSGVDAIQFDRYDIARSLVDEIILHSTNR